MDGGFIETPCQNFEEVPQTVAITKAATAVPKTTRPPLKTASLKDARAIIEEGAQKSIRRARARGPPLHINNHGVNVVEDTNSDCNLDNWIFPTINSGLNNCTARDFVHISFIQ